MRRDTYLFSFVDRGRPVLQAIMLIAAVAVGNCAVAQDDANSVSVFRYIPAEEHAAIRNGTSRYDVTQAIHAARDVVSGTGKILLFPAGTYYVGEVQFSGSNYRIETRGVTFRQKPGLGDGKQIHPIITFPQNANNIVMNDIRLIGNIATDKGEFSHGIAIMSADDITLGNVHGEDIRGDVLYTYGRTTSEGEYQRNLVTGVISGRNIYRCVVALVGGDATIAGIVQDGPVGYRDFDVEPNSGGAYQPVTAKVGFVRGSTIQIGSDDPNVINADVRVERVDLDGNRIANSFPAYPGHPGRNAIAFSISRVESVQIGDVSVQNYDSYPVALFDRWRSVRIGTLNFRNSNTVETTYRTIILQHGQAGDGVIAIDRIVGRLAGKSRTVFLSDRGTLNVDVGKMETSGGSQSLYISGRINGIRVKSGRGN